MPFTSFAIRSLAVIFLVNVLATSTDSKSLVSKKLRRLVCRQCWKKFYRGCEARVRLVKRSVDTLDQNSPMSAKRGRPVRPGKLMYRRRVRVQITSCKVCQDMCFQ